MGWTGGADAHVLVVEHDAVLADVFRDALADEGYRVTLALVSDLAPVGVAALGVDLVMLDLPFADGAGDVAFLKRLQADAQTAPLPVLVCSADHRRLEELAGRLAAWNCGTLAKPFGLDALLETTNDLLARSRALTARSHALRRQLVAAEDRLHDAIARADPDRAMSSAPHQTPVRQRYSSRWTRRIGPASVYSGTRATPLCRGRRQRIRTH